MNKKKLKRETFFLFDYFSRQVRRRCSRNVVDQVFAFDISRAQFVYLLLSRRLSSYPTDCSTVCLFSSSVV